jgi:carbon-monoxide dehydrogenase medium subunit
VKPAPFEYAAPERLEEAVGLLAEHGEEAKVLAGGQSLLPLLAMRLATPALLVDLNRIRGLDEVRIEDGTLTIGALARERAVEELPGLADRAPIVAEAVALIGHVAIRNRGTVGGSIAHADPAAEWPALLLALDGEVEVVGPGGPRTIPAPELFETYFTTSLQPTEVIREVRVRLPGPGAGSAFVEFARRHGDFALAGAGAVLELAPDGAVADVRVALIGVRDTAVRSGAAEAVLRGERPTDEAIRAAAAAVDADVAPLSDVHASAEFRRHLASVMARRALLAARARAGGGGEAG